MLLILRRVVSPCLHSIEIVTLDPAGVRLDGEHRAQSLTVQPSSLIIPPRSWSAALRFGTCFIANFV